ncbi:2-hydroxyacid dehydrogenase [Ornithinimicrobium sp. W1679]|uniref:2-hydroxyacid dehydrogenase n=1 Tax=Ornithinimicrobium sp. W1679 TaxID=3418770 RepID=UPI003CF53700
MTSAKVLMPNPAGDLVLEACQGLDLLTPWRADGDPVVDLDDVREQVVVIANPGESVVDDALMDSLPRLGLIAHFGVGYDSVDVAAAAERGIVVTNVGGANEEEVADTALGLMIMTVRQLGRAEQHLRSGRWAAGETFPLTDGSLTGSVLGILGMGRIGQAIARRAQACRMEVAYHTRRRRDLPFRYLPSAVDLARASDVLVVATPGGPQTEGLVSEDVLEALGPGGVLINVARGSIVDEEALVRLLSEGRLGGAGLDVFADEPRVPPQLLEMEHVVLLPHVGSASVPTRRGMARLGRRNIDSFLTDGTVLTPVPETGHLATVVPDPGPDCARHQITDQQQEASC